MANIVTFQKNKTQNNPVVQNGQTATYEENWMLNLDSEVSALHARVMIKNLAAGNEYGWPVIGKESHPDSSVMFPTEFRVTRNEFLTTRHDIQLTYTDEVNEINRSQRARDAKPTYDYQDVDVVEEVQRDPINDKMIAASNGEQPFPLPQRSATLTRIIVTRNEKSFNSEKMDGFKKKLNQGTFRIDNVIYGSRKILCETINGRSAIDVDGVQYYIVTYRFLNDKDQHKFIWVDAGKGVDVDGKNPAIDHPGKSFKLDGEGAYMSRARQRDASDVVWNENYLYDEVNMGSLNL
ncbi:MAG: hypothetical protein NE327_12425 [Lentisphaeraceae bacterium]|nr:hypothetical protein [Lentisphaeraceae bacterium]